jgi:hypothetical protein
MATQAIDSQSLEYCKDKIATKAEKIAINKSRILGLVLAKISGVSIQIATKKAKIYHIKIEAQILINKTFKDMKRAFFSHELIQRATPLIGLKRGAISIAPIITATEFWIKPRVAIELERKISNQYNLSHLEYSFVLIAISCLSSGFNSKIAIFSKNFFNFSSKFNSSGICVCFSCIFYLIF